LTCGHPMFVEKQRRFPMFCLVYTCVYIIIYIIIYIYTDIWYMCSFLLVSCVFSYFNPLDRSRCFPVIYEDR
jgi:hypothetical protein